MNRKLDHKKVYEILPLIPSGKVSTYGDIAKLLKIPKASRGIARILNVNPEPITIPCYKVVQSNGYIGGYAHGVRIKKELLEKEGIKINAKGFIDNFDKVRFNFK